MKGVYLWLLILLQLIRKTNISVQAKIGRAYGDRTHLNLLSDSQATTPCSPMLDLKALIPALRAFSYRKIKGGVTMNIYENYVAKIIFDKIICWELSYGPGSRTWTDTMFPPRDFKSLASAYFAIPGYIIYKAVHHTPFTTAPYLIPILVYPGFH